MQSRRSSRSGSMESTGWPVKRNARSAQRREGDFTSQTLASFRGTLVGACGVPDPASYYLEITQLCTTGSTRTDAHRRHRTIKRLAVHSVLSQPNQINQLALVIALLTVIQHSTLAAIYTTIVRDNSPPFKVCQKFSNLLAVKAYFFFQKGRANLWSRHRFLL